MHPARTNQSQRRLLHVTRSVVIDRAPDHVAAQFADVGHHERTSVHRGVTFQVTAEDSDWCEYEQCSRLGPRTIRQRYRLDRRDPHHQLNTVIDGMFEGGTLAFDIAPRGPTTSEVTATLTVPSSTIAVLLGPVIRGALGRSLSAALNEDKQDLESDSYTAAPDPRPRRDQR